PKIFPDYILLDLRMPEMHGFDFIREFEKSFPQRINKTVFIITTSSVIQKEKDEAFKFESVKEYIVKPIPPDYIEKLVTVGLESQPQL
ncbi:MAG TPA: response regulator, partial [Prolixibacteraceae bacterium]|nr:response regulator [Prolixibacteraceae bacterium]